MSQPSQFWDRHAKGYAKRVISDEAAYQKKLKLTQDVLKADMEVLEFGCGTGTTALIQARFVKHIRAIDISAKMLEIARTKAASAKITNVTFEQSGIEELEAPDHTYDAVMGHSILHLLEDRDVVINKVHRLLKPGGVFVTSTACLGRMIWIIKALLRAGRVVGLLPMIKFFTVEEFAGSLTAAGFRIDEQWQPGKGLSVFIIATKV